ncbi:sensor histidine kinase [Sciscionella marina]|uniref:sensor histidine kinase n=1 Tax=Sciscionella marina TaxID=508770 RepID=UPI000366EB64|nr:sensor histidine kinase [Sciscionella marina]
MRSWESHRHPVVTVLPYVLLAGLTAFTIIEKHADGASLAVDLGLCGLAALWMLFLFTLFPEWRLRPGVMTVFVLGLLAIMALLVVRDPWFGAFVPAAYVYAFRLIPWPWQLPVIAAVALIAGTAQATEIDKTTMLGLLSFAAVLVVNVVPMCVFAWLIWHGGRRNDERERALAETRDANRRLAASLEENARLHEELLSKARDAGVHDERQRMAREIHDTLAQGLTGIIAQLRAAEQDIDGRGHHIESATQLARESLAEARRSVGALRPEPLRTARLEHALGEVAERWSTRNGVAAAFTTTGSVRPLDAEAETALLRITQEALANVGKHAEASRVGVTLSYFADEVAVDVRDDGKGFNLNERGADSSVGLLSMRQRAEQVGGTLQVESDPGAGTGISARVPVVAEGNATVSEIRDESAAGPRGISEVSL